MRRFILFLLMASAAIPSVASAAPQDREDRREAREEARKERAEAREQRQADRPARVQSHEAPRQKSYEPQREQREHRVEQRMERRDQRREVVEQRQRAAGDTVREWRGGNAQERMEQVRERRVDRRNDRIEQRAERINRGPRIVTPPPVNARPDRPAPVPVTASRYNGSNVRWHNDWRHDGRYDWRRYRDRNRFVFNVGFYYDPFGWSYRRFPIGWRLWPSYYSSSYWLNDPWMYRLPPAYGPYRWVRYWNDAVLVNIYTGQVADVVYDFFW